ncbi:hypothetical protein [Lactobacillus taiwanensis]|uniref:hypothetical protein n=1 Tax=Lactobacillus taiwanensis TaxID=508451 RepID=UPI00321FD7FE
MKNNKKFTDKHPYLTALLAVVIGSASGAILSLLFTGDYNIGGIYFSLISIVILFVGIKKSNRRNKK